MNHLNLYEYAMPNAGLRLRNEAEALIADKSITKLRKLDDLLVQLIAQQITNNEVSYIDLSEYVSYAIEQLEQGVEVSVILVSPLRTNIYT